METNILLESGTNELELLEFFVGNEDYGINIAKVSEILTYREVTPMPSTPDEVEGVVMPRDKLITVVDLHKVLDIPQPVVNNGLLIVCEFNQLDSAFHVSTVKGIQRISWSNIEKPPTVANNSQKGVATGIAKVDGKIIIILDFEKIIADLNCSAGLDSSGIEKLEKSEEVDYNAKIVIAEDSPLLNQLVVNAFTKAGFHNILSFSNGQEAWNYISSYADSDDVTSHISLLVSDIEMPQMDGHRLTKLIKDHRNLNKIPVFLFSSLIDDQMKLKGKSVGADEQFSKPQIGGLIQAVMAVLKK
ncbi:MAG: chemotaxis protein CheV [Ruminiclostridium sp.]|nr:chemotaxis protein CheV [Ruminiclostridium sp.]